MILLHQKTCDYCGTCLGVCPENCITLEPAALIIDHDACTECKKCIWACPLDALYGESDL